VPHQTSTTSKSENSSPTCTQGLANALHSFTGIFQSKNTLVSLAELLQRGFTLTTRLFPILGFFFAVHDVLSVSGPLLTSVRQKNTPVSPTGLLPRVFTLTAMFFAVSGRFCTFSCRMRILVCATPSFIEPRTCKSHRIV
jgi:hypothetical protein